MMIRIDEEIELALLQEQDAAELFAVVDRNRAHLRRFLGWLDYNRSEEDSRQFIRQQQELFERGESVTFAVRVQEMLVGLVGLQQIDSLNRSASIGYWIDAECEGRGIMTRSVEALLDYGREKLELHRFQIFCAVENTRSQKIPVRLGFEREGCLREAIRHYDRYLDAYLYALIAETATR